MKCELQRDTQCELFLLLHLLTRHYGAATMSLKVTRSFDGARIVTLACIAAIADGLLRKVACDIPSQLSLHYSGQAPAPMCTPFYIDTNSFAAESACLKFVEPELATSRCMVLDYFHSLRSADEKRKINASDDSNILFRFEGGVGLGKGEVFLLHQLCIQMGYPTGDIQMMGQYLSGENRSIIDIYPEFQYFRDINFMLRLLMVPSNENMPRRTKWKATDAELTWCYVPPKKNNSSIGVSGVSNSGSSATEALSDALMNAEITGTFQVIGFQNRILSWKNDGKRESQSSEIINGEVSTGTNRGFLTRIFLGKGKRIGRAPQSLANPSHLAGTEILDEEDVLHVDKLPNFGGRLPAQHCEVLLQFLTVPYLRIPLVMQWFSQPLQVTLLNVPALQEMLDACLFEPGVWKPNSSSATSSAASTRVPLLIPPPTFDHMVTPCGLLFQELTTSPNVVCTALEDLLIQAIEMDTGTYTESTSEILLYIVRLIVRIESFMILILERARLDDDDDINEIETEEENSTNSTDSNRKYSSACCARGLSVPINNNTDLAQLSTTSGGVDMTGSHRKNFIGTDPIDILRHAKLKLRSLLDHRVIYIVERWCNSAMKSRNMIVASKLHTHLAYMQKNRQYHEYREMSISILLIAQMFLTSRVNFDAMEGDETKKKKNAADTRDEHSLVHHLGIPQTEIFDLFQRTRIMITKWLREHPRQKNGIMESIVRVVTLTGTRKQAHENDTTEDRGDVDMNREWVELSTLNKYGMIGCASRWVPTTEHHSNKNGKKDNDNDNGDKNTSTTQEEVKDASFEEWLRRTTTEAADTEINVQLGEFALKKNRVETLPSSTRTLPDFVAVFGNNELASGVASATVQRCQYRNWLRLVGRRHDVLLWTKPRLTYHPVVDPTLGRLYNPTDGVGGGLLSEESWIREILEPIRQKWFPNIQLYMKTTPHKKNNIAARFVGHWPHQEGIQHNLALHESATAEKNKKKRSSQRQMADAIPTTKMREIIVLKSGCVQLYDLLEHGRRFYRTLTYASDVHHCYTSFEGKYNPSTQTCETKGGLPPIPPSTSSIVITRNLSTDIGKQTYVPSRFLNGLLPECLRTQYDFWQSDSNTIQGYERNPSTTSSHTTALIILLSTHGSPADLSGSGNGRAHAFVTRIPVRKNNVEEDKEMEIGKGKNTKTKERSISITDVVSTVMDKIDDHKIQLRNNQSERGSISSSSSESTNMESTNMESTQMAQSMWKRANKKVKRRIKRKSIAMSKELLEEAGLITSMHSIAEDENDENEDENENETKSKNDGDNEGKEGRNADDTATTTTYDVSSLRLTLLNALYAPEGSFLQAVSNIFCRLDSFAHLLIWTKDRIVKDEQTVIPDIIELSRLGLTFRRNPASQRLYCDQHAGYFISNLVEKDSRLKALIKGMPNALLLEKDDGQLQFIVSALASPFRSENQQTQIQTQEEISSSSHRVPNFPYGAIYEYHDRDWVKKAAHVGHYVLPVHMSCQFLFTPTLSSALYLLMIKFFQRDYAAVCALAPSVVSDSTLDDNEQQLLEHLEYLSSDTHPDAHACRVKLSLALMGNEEYMTCPWDFQHEYTQYCHLFPYVSNTCKLSPSEEYQMHDLFHPEEKNDEAKKASIDEDYGDVNLQFSSVRINVLRRCASVYKRLGQQQQQQQQQSDLDLIEIPLKTCFTFSRAIQNSDVIFDTLHDTSVFAKDSLSKLSKLSYNRPKYNAEEEKDVIGTNYEFVCRVTSTTLKLKGNGKYSLGFLFLYELFTKSTLLPLTYGIISPDYDKKEILGSLLLRLMNRKETQTKSVLMSILRQLEGGLQVLPPTPGLGGSIDREKHVIDLREVRILRY